MEAPLLPAYRRLAEFFASKGEAPLSATEVAVCLEWLQEVTIPDRLSFLTLPTDTKMNMSTLPPPPPRSNFPENISTVKKPSEGNFINPDLTPVKQQIRELLLSSTHSTLANVTTTSSSSSSLTIDISKVPKQEEEIKQDSIIMEAEKITPNGPIEGHSEISSSSSSAHRPALLTRTAKTILDVLDNPNPPSPVISSTPTFKVASLNQPDDNVPLKVPPQGINPAFLKNSLEEGTTSFSYHPTLAPPLQSPLTPEYHFQLDNNNSHDQHQPFDGQVFSAVAQLSTSQLPNFHFD